MENCLVTKCKASVSNDNLEYLGAIVINVPAMEIVDYNQRKIAVRPVAGKTLHAKVVGGTFVDNQGASIGTERDITIGDALIVSNTDCKVIINNKYDIQFLNNPSGTKTVKDVSFFGHNASVITFLFPVDGDVSDMQGTFDILSCVGAIGSLAKCTMNMTTSGKTCRIGSDVSALPNFANGCRGEFDASDNKKGILNMSTFTNTNFDVVRLRNSVCNGDVIDIINSNLTIFDAINATGLSGSVEACMEKLWGLGVRNRTNMQFSKCNDMTLHGNKGNQDLKVTIANDGITVKTYFSGDTLATYDGTNWTYA